MVSFLGISDDTVVKQGTEFKRSHFVKSPFPQIELKVLKILFTRWDQGSWKRVWQSRATRVVNLSQDNQTPPMELDLKSNEVLLTISVSNRSPLIQPGDMIFGPQTESKQLFGAGI